MTQGVGGCSNPRSGFLHEATLSSAHRIVLLLRGPRQPGAHLFLAQHRTDASAVVPPRLAGPATCARASRHERRLEPRNSYRKDQGRESCRRVPLYGQIHVRTAPGKHHSLRTTEPIGSLLQALREGVWKRESTGGDPGYRMRARMATALGDQGSVLIVEPTKLAAQRTAGAVADEIDEDDAECAALVALATPGSERRIPSLQHCVEESGFTTPPYQMTFRPSSKTEFGEVRSATSWRRPR